MEVGKSTDELRMVKLHDRMNAALLEYERAQGIESVFPFVIEMHQLLEEAALHGHETTTVDETDTWECICDGMGRYGKRVTVHVMECSACGHTYEHVNGDYEFCPHCRARIVEVDDG